MELVEFIVNKTGLQTKLIENVLTLFENNNTIPFIIRYRKHLVGNLLEDDLNNIKKMIELYETTLKRKKTILEKLNTLTPQPIDVIKKISQSYDLDEIEILYEPYKVAKKNKSQKARELGLERVSNQIFFQKYNELKKEEFFSRFAPTNLSYEEIEEGVFELLKEKYTLNKVIKDICYNFIYNSGILISKKKKKAEERENYQNFKDYFDYSEKIKYIAENRILAILRGYAQKILNIDITFDYDLLYKKIRNYVKLNETYTFYYLLDKALNKALKDSIIPSIKNKILKELKQKAEEKSIEIYKKNLEALLLSPPAGEKIILGVDPGFKNGCKCAIIDKSGNVLDVFKFYLENLQEAEQIISEKIKEWDVELIAIGDGVGGKESYRFLKTTYNSLEVTIVSEDGASIYSVSKKAEEELKDFDIIYRGAISIARRTQDPLAEYVKLDPRSLGVGQYQYDIDQKKLKSALDDTVYYTVNKIGCDVNTASKDLLKYISGLNETIAENIIKYRQENGRINNREELLKIPKIGAKVFENCAGFLTIKNGSNILDETNIHPEDYNIIYDLLHTNQLTWNALKNIPKQKFLELTDRTKGEFLYNEIHKSRRDPRNEFKQIMLNMEISSFEDLHENLQLYGIVKNITQFGVFVDIGLDVNGLIHRSNLPPDYNINIGDNIKVEVMTLSKEQKRINLKPLL